MKLKELHSLILIQNANKKEVAIGFKHYVVLMQETVILHKYYQTIKDNPLN